MNRNTKLLERNILADAKTFSQLFLQHWTEFSTQVQSKGTATFLDGHSLDLASVITVSRFDRRVDLVDSIFAGVTKSAEAVQGRLGEGEVIYGINTGFGGSADVRTQAVIEIQRGLIRGLHYRILAGGPINELSQRPEQNENELLAILQNKAIPLDDPVSSTTMPESWVRASMLIRLNSLAQGASGVRPAILKSLVSLLNSDISPRVPLRGSISASGDLSPLSYIGGVMQGKPAVQAFVGDRNLTTKTPRRLMRADQALQKTGLEPVDIRVKEGLALVNGTATSTAVAALAMHEALGQAALAQVLTAMSVEVLTGTPESFDPLFSQVRRHPGQTECASNILSFLSDSQFTVVDDGSEEFSLRQDRYSIRTASQWIGPILEDLVLSAQQVAIELNSVTDNPLVAPTGRLLHGGNFQAKVITTAMEKSRLACQALGQMIFSQCTELINPTTNRGLSPNLVVDEPSESWLWKGTDILVAALQSELGFLANPVGTHVQFAEMGNQALNSLALISARYTLASLDVLSHIAAAHLVALCQALDLRALHTRFLAAFEPIFLLQTQNCLLSSSLSSSPSTKPEIDSGKLVSDLWSSFQSTLLRSTHMDSTVRFAHALDILQAVLLRFLVSTDAPLDPLADPTHRSLVLANVQKWNVECATAANKEYAIVRETYLARPNAGPFLGKASKRMYQFVRKDLGLPFFGERYIRNAELVTDEWDSGLLGVANGSPLFRSMGEMISVVYEAIKDGRVYAMVVECMEEANRVVP